MDHAGFDFKIEKRTQNDLILTNGSKIFTKSCELTAEQKGPTVDVGFVDEAPDVPESTLREAVFFRGAATSAPYFLLGSPSGRMRNHVFFDMVQTGKAHITTADEARAVNPMFDRFVRDTIARYGEEDEYVQMQIFLRWIVGKNQFITPDQLALCRGNYAPISKAVNIPIYVGLDWGKSVDSTAIAIGTREGLKVRTLALLELIGEFQPDQTETIIRFISGFGRPKSIFCDSTATQYQATDYIKNEFSMTHYYNFTQQSKHDLFYNLHRLMRPVGGGMPMFEYPQPHDTTKLQGDERAIAAIANKTLSRFEDQMLGLEKEIVQGGIWRVAAPERKGAHDDLPCAVALMCIAASRQSSVAMIGFNEFSQQYDDKRDIKVREHLMGRQS